MGRCTITVRCIAGICGPSNLGVLRVEVHHIVPTLYLVDLYVAFLRFDISASAGQFCVAEICSYVYFGICKQIIIEIK